MAEELQALLKRINEEGFKKAEDERQELLGQAQAEAAKIVAAAETEAERIKMAAKQQADLLLTKGEESLRHAARDILLELRQRLEQRMQQVTVRTVREALKPETMADILKRVVEKFVEHDGTIEALDILVSKADLDAVQQIIQQQLAEDLREHCKLAPLPELDGGFKIVFEGANVMYDFSDQALADALAQFLNPALAELVREAADTDKQS